MGEHKVVIDQSIFTCGIFFCMNIMYVAVASALECFKAVRSH